jgi:hypothetical protein
MKARGLARWIVGSLFVAVAVPSAVSVISCNSVLGIPEVHLADAGATTKPPTDCAAGTKRCNGSCVLVTEPATGCAAESCDACTFAHGAAICVGGSCKLGQCEHGFEDCNHMPEDGCEANVDTDPGHCGDCNTACPTALHCVAGACVCQADTDCNGGTCADQVCSCMDVPCDPGDSCDADGMCAN